MRGPAGIVLVLAILLSACASTKPIDRSGGPTVTLAIPGVAHGPDVSGTVRVFVPSELRPVIDALKRAFERENPKARVMPTLDNARELIVLAVGGPAPDFYIATSPDVALLAAYVKNLDVIRAFGTDAYVISTPPGNPAHVTDLAGFKNARGDTAVCTPEFLLPPADEDIPPGLSVDPRTGSFCGTLAVARVAEGTLVAALVPRSDAARRSAEINIEEVPPENNVAADYRYARMGTSSAALGFENFLQSAKGVELRREYGYRGKLS